ncbi:MFS transporter [Chloroflexota bacterium]
MFYGWWIVVLLFLSSLFSGAVIWYGFTAFFSPLANEFGWSYTAISLAASLRGVEMGLLDMPAGFLVDRFGGRRIVFIGSMLVGLGYLILSGIDSLATFYISFLIIFCGATGLGMVVVAAILNRWFSKRLGLALGIVSAGFGAGGFAVPYIVYLMDLVGFRMVFVIFGIASIIIGGFLACFLRSRPEDIGYGPNGVLRYGREYTSERVNKHNVLSTSPAVSYTFKEAVSEPPFWIIAYVGTVSILTVSMVTTHVMPYLEHLGYSRNVASIAAMMIPVTSIVGRLGLGWISDLINRKLMLILITAGQFFAMVLFYYAHLSFLLIPFVLLFGVSYGGLSVLRVPVLKDYYGTTNIGSIIGVCFGLSAFGGIVGPLLAGWLFDTTNSYSLPWIISSILLLSSVPLILTLKNPLTMEMGYAYEDISGDRS